jgi:soluble lytic murein transglycosylase
VNYRKAIKIALTAISCLIFTSFLFGVFLCSYCFSSDKEEAKIYELITSKNYTQAISTLNSLASKAKDPQTKSKYQYLIATCNRMNGQWDSAISKYKLVAEDKELRFAEISRLRIAKRYQEISNYPSAINEYEKLLIDHPKSPSAVEAQYQIAECYSKMKNYEKAIDNYKEFIQAHPEGSRSRLCAYKIGYMYQEAKKFSEAYDQYQKVLRQYTDNYVAQQTLGRLKLLMASSSSITVSKEDSHYKGLTLYYAKQYKEAREELKKAINGSDELSAKSAYFIAKSYQKEGSYPLAQKEYEAFIKLYSKSEYIVEAEYQISQCVWKSGKIEEAVSLLMKFASDHPKSDLADDAELQIAQLYKEREQFTKALDAYSNVAEKYPTSDSADDALWNMGWCYMNLKNNDKSAQAFQRLISQYPSSDLSSSARFWTGVSYENMGSFQEAVTAYKQAMENKDWYYSDRAKRRIDLLFKAEKIDKETAFYQHKKAEFEEFLPVTTTIRQFTPLWVNEAFSLGVIDDVVEVFSALEESDIALESAYYNLSICYEKMGEYRTSWGYIWRLTRLPNIKPKSGMLPRQFFLRLFPSFYTEIVYSNSKANDVDPQLVSAVIREESRYDYKAVSSAGARGLMQIMPSTGKGIAKQSGVEKFETDMLFEPKTNIKMGSWYLSQLIDSFTARTREYFISKGTPQSESVYTDIAIILALGGYNAGPGRMRNWMEEYGIEDIDVFVENIPMQEPRYYIKKVLDSYEMYKSLYSG